MRVNRGQELVIGGFVSVPKNFESIVLGYYEGKQLLYVARAFETASGRRPEERGITAGYRRAVRADALFTAHL